MCPVFLPWVRKNKCIGVYKIFVFNYKGPLLIFAILLWVMVSQSFYAAKRIQAPPRSRPKVTLSKEARAALKFQRTEKSRQFKDALDLAWGQIDDVTTTIAATHRKSFRRVQHDLYMGRGSLRSKHSKPSVWNTFCWKKSQEAKKENCKSVDLYHMHFHDSMLN
jgi:hypothetical protein